MSFRLLGLAPDAFRPLFDKSDAQLRLLGARRVFATDDAMPCRVSLAHAAIGEELLLLNYTHQEENTPYRACHAIYVRRQADVRFDAIDVVPEVLSARLLAVRAFDREHMMVDAEVCEGRVVAEQFERMLADCATAYLQVHNARRGCYAARVERA